MVVHAKEIAQKLGLSPATVSLVLRGKPGISEKTRERVLQAAAGLGYSKPSGGAAAQRSSIRFILYKKHGAVVGDTAFFSQLTESINQEASRRGYDLLITYFYGNQNLEEQLQALKSTPCAGIILLATEMRSADLEPFKKLALPLVVLDSYFPDEQLDCILINNVYGAKHAVQHLIAKGHSEIGYLSSSITIRNFHERQDGYLRGIKTIPVANDSRRYLVKVSPTAEGAFRDMTAYLAAAPKLPTAFFADNDLIAIACMRALRSAGYLIPNDISIIGFDGISTGELLDTPLTTMNVHKEQLGLAAVERLDDRIHGRAKGIVKIEVATELVERSTVQRIG